MAIDTVPREASLIIRYMLVMAFFIVSSALIANEHVIPHQDRETPKVIFKNDSTHFRAKTARLAAEQYLEREWERFELAPQGRNLVLERTQKSLLGTHFHYRQQLHDVPVERGTFVVTIDKQNRVSQIYNNTFPVKNEVPKPPENLISGDDALLISWSEIGVTGELVTQPQAELCYRFKDQQFQLIYRTNVPVSEPIGKWRLALDPLSGRVLELDNMLIMHRHGARVQDVAMTREHLQARYPEQVRDFYDAMSHLDARNQKRNAKQASASKRKVDGTGTVFDPDPRTTLLDFTFEDFTSESVLADAYQTVPLRDITENEDGTFSLAGPYVTIDTIIGQFFSPDTPVVDTQDGNWNFTRGTDGFNNATVYHQLDQNQRYIQSLGFTGETGIQEDGVMADTDAWDGQDNSFFFDPNLLAFGKGGVDDAEDADVVLHEYGHGLQNNIVPTWDVRGDADEGGIGEGFGDYWAGSYSLSTPNGYKGFPNRVFSWDGHNENWPGRRLDRLDLNYSFSTNYDDHQCVVPLNECFSSGGESDELWSSPLFQTLLELFRRGIPREELDRIVLQSHFGIGDSVQMHDLSAATINTAVSLHPNGPHAQTLQNMFSMVGIEQPVASYTYIAPHIPFCNDNPNDVCVPENGFWYAYVEVANPNVVNASVTLETFGDNGSGTYELLGTETVSIAAGETYTFVPPQTTQRWVRITSNQPLGGSQYFERTGLNAGEGTESAAIPLITGNEVANTLILPHIPANREGFWSGAVVVNTTDQPQTLLLKPIGDNGTDLSDQFDAASLSRTLAPFEKLISFITPVNNFPGALVDDSALAEKVSYLELTSTGDMAAFELFGYNASNAELATTGIVAMPDQDRTAWAIRSALTEAEFNGFTVLNPDDEAKEITVSVFDDNGNTVASTTTTIAARTKLLGLNTNFGGFTFPSNGTPLISEPDFDRANTVLIQGHANLRIFDLSGDLSNTTIDGGAVRGLTTKTAFTKPRGTLRLIQSIEEETVSIETYTRNGGTLQKTTETVQLQAGETRTFTIDGEPETIVVRGAFVNPSVITRNNDTNVLLVRNGHQVEIGPNDIIQ